MERNYEIIAVDFDGTLCFSKWPDCGEPNQPLINYLKKWKSDGNKLILWTCRIAKLCQMQLPGVTNTDLSSMQSMTTFRKSWDTMAAIAGKLHATGILMIRICFLQ